eukprot:11486077-Alexandrium_andersonii.AAC.1
MGALLRAAFAAPFFLLWRVPCSSRQARLNTDELAVPLRLRCAHFGLSVDGGEQVCLRTVWGLPSWGGK